MSMPFNLPASDVETRGNHGQRDLMLGPLPTGAALPVDTQLIAMCDSEVQAVQMCWQCRRVNMTQRAAAERMGVSTGTFSKYLNGSLGLTADKRVAMQRVCGNTAITQWEAWQMGQMLVPRQPTQQEIYAMQRGAA